jgi:hypothetical protein
MSRPHPGITALDRVALAIASRDTPKALWQEQRLTTAAGREVAAKDLPLDSIIERMVYGLSVSQLFSVDNVRDWLLDLHLTGREAFKLMADLPSSVPPYPYTYLEWDDQGVRCSAYMVSGSQTDDSGWRKCSISVFDTSPSPLETHFLGTLGVTFTAEGRVVCREGDPSMPDVTLHINPLLHKALAKNADTMLLVQGQMARTVGIALFTCSLLHCKNVQAVEVDPRASMTRQQRRADERSKHPLVHYKVLEVNPLRTYRLGEDEREGDGALRRLHHVRGHFVEYGPAYGKGLLFGRLEGRFFIEPHVRGDLTTGVVAKTYALAKKRDRQPVQA